MAVRVFSEILGKYVEIPEEPRRIVSLAPAVTDTLHAIGAWDRVVGVSYFCQKPREAREKPKLGSYFNVNYRLLEELQPDLVLVTSGAQRRLALELAEKGYTVYPIPLPTSVYGVVDNVVTVGLVTGLVGEARRVAAELARRVAVLAEKPLGLRVYYEVDLGEPITVGSMTYIDHALSLLGLENIYGWKRATYFNPDPAYVVEADPDIVLYEPKPFTKIDPAKIVEKLASRPGWRDMRAFREGRVLVLEPDSLAHYGPALIGFLEDLREKLATYAT